MDITTGAQTLSAPAAFPGVLDTSTIPADADLTIHTTVDGLAAGESALIVIEDTANATPFSDAHQIVAQHVAGPIQHQAPIALSWRRYELAAIRTGAANCALRARLVSISAGASVTFHAGLYT